VRSRRSIRRLRSDATRADLGDASRVAELSEPQVVVGARHDSMGSRLAVRPVVHSVI
jgi:hypothetical protein